MQYCLRGVVGEKRGVACLLPTVCGWQIEGSWFVFLHMTVLLCCADILRLAVLFVVCQSLILRLFYDSRKTV